MPSTILTQNRVRELLDYDLLTGIFRWKFTRRRVRQGEIAGTTNYDGYIYIQVDKTIYPAHRLAFLYVINAMPKEIDHINHVRNDNRWINFRFATRTQNCRNRALHKSNISGCNGVTWKKSNKAWQVRVGTKYLGIFKDLDEAIAVRKAANIRHKYHPNHS